MTNFQGKFWCFTLNNPTIEDHPPNIWPDVKYVIWQHERGENGTEHLQGYVAFTKVKRLNWIRAHCVQAHWTPRSGSHEQAKHYCMKPVEGCDCKHCKAAAGQRLDGFWEHGDDEGIAQGQGQRNDLVACKELIDNGASELEIAESHFGSWARHHKAFERYRKLKHQMARNWITTVTVLWGAPGIGKSMRARYEAGENAYWLPQPEAGGSVWWDGYDGQEVVVIDEFYGWIKRITMQRLCDSTPIMVQNKGGSTPFTAKRIIITSNEPPSQWWKNIGLGPMERRLTGEHGKVIHMTTDWVRPEEEEENQEAPAIAVEEDEIAPIDLMDEWAMHGTPVQEIPSSPIGVHAQPPLRRCAQCQGMLYLDGTCDQCQEFMEWGAAHNLVFVGDSDDD